MLSANTKKLSLLTLIILFFIVPFLLAEYYYYHGGIKGGITNKGVLINNPSNIKQLNLKPFKYTFTDKWADEKWHIIYLSETKCSNKCKNILYKLQQVHIALGKNTNRVQRVILHNTSDYLTNSNQSYWKSIYKKYPHMTVQVNQAPLKNNKINKVLAKNNIYLADPLGNIILSYSIDSKDNDSFDSNIYKDTKKLLNLSMIG